MIAFKVWVDGIYCGTVQEAQAEAGVRSHKWRKAFGDSLRVSAKEFTNFSGRTMTLQYEYPIKRRTSRFARSHVPGERLLAIPHKEA